MLDMVAALLVGRPATHEIPPEPELETGLSQVFLAIDPAALAPARDGARRRRHRHLHSGDGEVRYPGERALETRRRSLAEGVPVDPAIWSLVRSGAW